MKEYRDHYFLKAKRENYPARSVYKLKELDAKFKLFRQGMRVLDLGAAPGSWSLGAAEKVGQRGLELACEALEVARLHLKPGGSFIVKIFMGPDIQEMLQPMRRAFKAVKSFKPKSSRAESKETFFVGMGFKAEARPAAQDAGTDGAADTGQEPGVL